jgi:hypothetical protein
MPWLFYPLEEPQYPFQKVWWAQGKTKQVLEKSKSLVFLVLGFLHSMRGEFTDVSETTVGPIFTGHK